MKLVRIADYSFETLLYMKIKLETKGVEYEIQPRKEGKKTQLTAITSFDRS